MVKTPQSCKACNETIVITTPWQECNLYCPLNWAISIRWAKSQATTDVFREIVDHQSLVDIWHNYHLDDSTTFAFVWVEDTQSCCSQLDHIYIYCFHILQAHSSSIRQAPFSDHYLVAMMASLTPDRPKPAYWHFSHSLFCRNDTRWAMLKRDAAIE
ncbi:unnamed protein product [Caretta caretta]